MVPKDRMLCRAARRAVTALALAGALAAASCADLDTVPVSGAAPTGHVSSARSQSTQAILRKVLSDGASSSPGPDRLLAFYRSRDFQPAWTGSAQQESLAAEAEVVLARAHEQGLNDADYRIPMKLPQISPSGAAAFEIRFTDALLRYARNVRTGRVWPGAVYDDVELEKSSFDPAAALSDALSRDSLKSFLAGLPPAHPQYRLLAAALARYRAVAEAGGWPSLGTKEIGLDGHNSRLKKLAARLAFEDRKLSAIAKPSPAQLRDAVKRFQARNSLPEDGRVRGKTLAALNVPARRRAEQIAANMERWRWLPPDLGSRYIAVDAADQSVAFVKDGKTVLRSRVIVGRKSMPTPITQATVQAVIVNPPWDIPGDIAAQALLPRLIRDRNYLATHHMVLMNGPPGDPYGRTIAWRKVVPAEFPYAVRQLPSATSALGVLMLDSPDDFDVYLHDTPNKKPFAADDREISHGCVRVQKIFPLSSLALTDDAAAGVPALKAAVKTHQTQRLALSDPLPVYFLYWTAVAAPDGDVAFRPDRYDRDPPLIAALSGSRHGAPAAAPDSRSRTGSPPKKPKKAGAKVSEDVSP
jgi:murein L,D-transpeptidase YcbB/YkuD